MENDAGTKQAMTDRHCMSICVAGGVDGFDGWSGKGSRLR